MKDWLDNMQRPLGPLGLLGLALCIFFIGFVSAMIFVEFL